VLLVERGRAVKVPVKVGLRGEGWIEITAGLAGGESIVPGSNSKVKAGQRLRPSPRA
jgi:HlyD family secretion protein